MWGSYWKDGRWGFGCCHSLEKNSYCLGEQGKVVNDRSHDSLLRSVVGGDAADEETPKTLMELHAEKQKADKAKPAQSAEEAAAEKQRKLKEVGLAATSNLRD